MPYLSFMNSTEQYVVPSFCQVLDRCCSFSRSVESSVEGKLLSSEEDRMVSEGMIIGSLSGELVMLEGRVEF